MSDSPPTADGLQWCYYTIQIQVKDERNYRRAQGVIRDLRDHKITFDTGSDGIIWEWEIDWSLKGGTPTEVRSALDKQGVVYEVLIRSREHEDRLTEDL